MVQQVAGVEVRPGERSVSLAKARLDFACPLCRAPLEAHAVGELRCPNDGAVYRRIDGIWRFLLPERAAYFEQFVQEYETVRRAEGRGSDDPAYYLALPYDDRSGRFRQDWHIRTQSFLALVRQVVEPIERLHAGGHPLKALDLGAGNGWLSYRLAERSWQAAAVDLLVDPRDGLGAHRHYPFAFTPVQAEFERLPLAGGQFDLAVFNGSLHYATSYETTLGEALRMLRPGGSLAILDSPVYRDARSGRQMVAEREAEFTQRYGFASNAIASENYLTYERLDELAARLGLRWTLVEPAYGWRWAVRPWKAKLLGRREPARFLLVMGQRTKEDTA